MSDGLRTIENIIPSITTYRGNEDEAKSYVECLQSEEAMRATWLEKIKTSSAENFKAGFLAGSNSQGDLRKKLIESDDVRYRLFETIPAPCKSMNTNTFQR